MTCMQECNIILETNIYLNRGVVRDHDSMVLAIDNKGKNSIIKQEKKSILEYNR